MRRLAPWVAAAARLRAPRWEDDVRNRAWLDEIEAAIEAGDLVRLERAQAAVRLPIGERPQLQAAAAAVPYRPLAAGVEDVELPEFEPEFEETPVAQPAPPVKKLRGAYARRMGGSS